MLTTRSDTASIRGPPRPEWRSRRRAEGAVASRSGSARPLGGRCGDPGKQRPCLRRGRERTFLCGANSKNRLLDAPSLARQRSITCREAATGTRRVIALALRRRQAASDADAAASNSPVGHDRAAVMMRSPCVTSGLLTPTNSWRFLTGKRAQVYPGSLAHAGLPRSSPPVSSESPMVGRPSMRAERQRAGSRCQQSVVRPRRPPDGGGHAPRSGSMLLNVLTAAPATKNYDREH